MASAGEASGSTVLRMAAPTVAAPGPTAEEETGTTAVRAGLTVDSSHATALANCDRRWVVELGSLGGCDDAVEGLRAEGGEAGEAGESGNDRCAAEGAEPGEGGTD